MVNGQTDCYHEAGDGQCFKPACPFAHRKPKGVLSSRGMNVVRVERRDGGFSVPPEEMPIYAPEEQAISIKLPTNVEVTKKSVPVKQQQQPESKKVSTPASPTTVMASAATATTPSFQIKTFDEIMREKAAKRAADVPEPVKRPKEDLPLEPKKETPVLQKKEMPVEQKNVVEQRKEEKLVEVKGQAKVEVSVDRVKPVAEVKSAPTKSVPVVKVTAPPVTSKVTLPPVTANATSAPVVAKVSSVAAKDDFDIDQELAELDALLAK